MSAHDFIPLLGYATPTIPGKDITLIFVLLKICCGCFGPDGGTDNYCRPNCTAINGGTVVEHHTYTWFWVRTSLPKRVWNRCMDYKVRNSNGEMVSYRLLDGDTIPEKVHQTI
jgi:hypothetical protein